MRPFSEQERQNLAQRNAQRVAEVIKSMGTKYLLHPANRVQRIQPKGTK